VNKRRGLAKKRGGKKKTKNFYDCEALSDGGSEDEFEESGSDRYESDFICDDEHNEVGEEGTFVISEDEYFSKSEGSSNESDWSNDSRERFEEMELVKNDGRSGENKYRYCKDEDNYYLERRFKIYKEVFEKL